MTSILQQLQKSKHTFRGRIFTCVFYASHILALVDVNTFPSGTSLLELIY